MKKTLLAASFMLGVAAQAQVRDSTKNWIKGGNLGLNFSQSSFTNWAAGGENALSLTTYANVFSNYKKGENAWDNSLSLAYGMIQSGHTAVRKNEDKIDFTSKYGRAFSKHWFYSALLNAKSQFAAGYNYPDDSTAISRFAAPAYLLVALGADYKTTDGVFTMFISPLTMKTTIVNDRTLANAGAYGVEAAEYDDAGVLIKDGKMARYEVGGYLRAQFKKDIAKNVNLASKLELFSNYIDRPQNIDVNWEVLINMKINKFLTCNVATQMIYDNDIPVPVEREENGVKVMGTGPRLQFKEVLSLGLSFKF
ncbi:MAG TPA: DUF3078 domain-containing protein [Bacteroidia bacterium]|jgi:hypothetical protein|nr:DUF3078 domain-containing protein [Bacteroidia bacterium]